MNFLVYLDCQTLPRSEILPSDKHLHFSSCQNTPTQRAEAAQRLRSPKGAREHQHQRSPPAEGAPEAEAVAQVPRALPSALPTIPWQRAGANPQRAERQPEEQQGVFSPALRPQHGRKWGRNNPQRIACPVARAGPVAKGPGSSKHGKRCHCTCAAPQLQHRVLVTRRQQQAQEKVPLHMCSSPAAAPHLKICWLFLSLPHPISSGAEAAQGTLPATPQHLPTS